MRTPSGAAYRPNKVFRLHRGLSILLTAVEPWSHLTAAVLIVASFAVASLIDYVVVPWPYVVAPLYGVPILIASVSLRPRAVGVTAAVALVLDIVSSVVQRLSWLPASTDAFGLLLIAGLALLSARHRVASEEANRRLHTFMGFVAHELRTPLTTQ